MTKLIIAALDADADTLLSPDLRAALTAAGADRVQVNAPDPAFGEKKRIQELPRPVTGTVQVWSEGRDEELLAAARGHLGDDVAAWEVEEVEVIAGPVDGDGVRTTALAQLAFLRKPADLTHDAWLTHWKQTHTRVAIDTQDTFGYVQNRVLRPLTALGSDVVAVVEELFHEAAVDDHHVFYGSGGDSAELKRRVAEMVASCTAFGANRNLDLAATARYRWGF